MALNGWLIQSQSEAQAQLTRKAGKNKWLVILLFLFFIVPGIFYLLIPTKTEIVILKVDLRGKLHVRRMKK